MSVKGLNSAFYEFSKSMRVLAIMSILILIPYVSFVAMGLTFVFIIVASVNIRNINNKLNNAILSEYRSKLLKGVITRIIGLFIVAVCFQLFLAMINRRGFAGIISIIEGYWLYGTFHPVLVAIIVWGVLIAVGFLLVIIGSSTEMGAWKLFSSFLQENKELFPQAVYIDSMDGADKCRTGALMFALGFLIVPLIIGSIFRIIGFFNLTSFGNVDFESAEQVPSAPKQVIQPITKAPNPEPQLKTVETIEKAKFCPNCAAETTEEGRYCGFCGAALYND